MIETILNNGDSKPEPIWSICITCVTCNMIVISDVSSFTPVKNVFEDFS